MRCSFSLNRGHLFVMNGAPVLWMSKMQTVNALSTCESEYVALAGTCKEVTWLRRVAQFMGVFNNVPLTIHVDNTTAISVAKNTLPTSRTKHIDLRMPYSKECIQRGVVSVVHVDSKHNLSDFLTKPLAKDQHNYLLHCAGIKV